MTYYRHPTPVRILRSKESQAGSKQETALVSEGGPFDGKTENALDAGRRPQRIEHAGKGVDR